MLHAPSFPKSAIGQTGSPPAYASAHASHFNLARPDGNSQVPFGLYSLHLSKYRPKRSCRAANYSNGFLGSIYHLRSLYHKLLYREFPGRGLGRNRHRIGHRPGTPAMPIGMEPAVGIRPYRHRSGVHRRAQPHGHFPAFFPRVNRRFRSPTRPSCLTLVW